MFFQQNSYCVRHKQMFNFSETHTFYIILYCQILFNCVVTFGVTTFQINKSYIISFTLLKTVEFSEELKKRIQKWKTKSGVRQRNGLHENLNLFDFLYKVIRVQIFIYNLHQLSKYKGTFFSSLKLVRHLRTWWLMNVKS